MHSVNFLHFCPGSLTFRSVEGIGGPRWIALICSGCMMTSGEKRSHLAREIDGMREPRQVLSWAHSLSLLPGR